jgi:hypothetical protein
LPAEGVSFSPQDTPAIVVKNCPIFPCFARKRKKLHSSQLAIGGTIVTYCEYKCYRHHGIGFGSLDATMGGVNS